MRVRCIKVVRQFGNVISHYRIVFENIREVVLPYTHLVPDYDDPFAIEGGVALGYRSALMEVRY